MKHVLFCNRRVGDRSPLSGSCFILCLLKQKLPIGYTPDRSSCGVWRTPYPFEVRITLRRTLACQGVYMQTPYFVRHTSPMSRRRVWMDNVVVSPSSRRRLNESPDQDIFRAFSAHSSARETLGFELRLPNEGPESKDAGGAQVAEQQNEEVPPSIDAAGDDDIRRSISAAYDGMLEQLQMLSPPHSPLQSPRRARQPPETVMLRIAGNRTPRLVVRLPNGGFSYAPSPIFEVVPPNAPRRRAPRTADVPLVRQHGPTAAEYQSVWRLRRQRGVGVSVDERIRRLTHHLRQTPAGRGTPSPPPPPSAPPPPPRSPVLERLRGNPIFRGRSPRHPLRSWRYVPEPPNPPLPPDPPNPPNPPNLPLSSVPSVFVTPEMGAPPGRCAICLEDFVPNTRLTWVSCQPDTHSHNDHVYHYTCICQWVLTCTATREGRRTCPECRAVW